MGLVHVWDHPSGRGKTTRDNGVDEYSRQLLIQVDGVATSAEEITASSQVPDLGDSHPDNTKAKCIAIDPTPYGDMRTVWMVDLRYTTGERKPEVTRQVKPWNLRAERSWDQYAVVEAITEDKDGLATLNPAKDPLDPPLEYEKHYPTLHIVRYEKKFNINTALDYIDHVNSGQITLCGLAFATELALLTKMPASEVTKDGVECWRVSYEIMFAPTWRRRVLNQGFNYWPGGYGSGGTTKKEFKVDGEPAAAQQLLSATGDEGSPVAPTYTDFKLYPRTSFGPLGLPKRA